MELQKLTLKMRRGATNVTPIRIESGKWIYVTITAVAQTAPLRITAPGHDLPDNWRAAIMNVKSVGDFAAANNPPKDRELHTITVVDDDTIEITSAAGWRGLALGILGSSTDADVGRLRDLVLSLCLLRVPYVGVPVLEVEPLTAGVRADVRVVVPRWWALVRLDTDKRARPGLRVIYASQTVADDDPPEVEPEPSPPDAVTVARAGLAVALLRLDAATLADVARMLQERGTVPPGFAGDVATIAAAGPADPVEARAVAAAAAAVTLPGDGNR